MPREDIALPDDLTMGNSDDLNSEADMDSALDDFLNSSDMLREAGVSTREEEEPVSDNAEDDDDLVDDESGDEEDEADGNDNLDDEDADDDDSDDDSTEDDDDEEEETDEIDWEFKVPVKIDGEQADVDLKELVKGYQTSQHLSKKGRELAQERETFETERAEEMSKVQETAKLLQAQTAIEENGLAKEYSELQERHKAAKKDGDKYEADQIKDEMEEIQQKHWTARERREKVAEALQKQEASQQTEHLQKQVEKFNQEINDYVPDFNEEKATQLREFALSKGIPEEVLQTLVDAKIIGAINEFMELSEKVSKGSAKRKAKAPRRPAATKKAKPASVKNRANQMKTSRNIQSGEASNDDIESALDALAGKYFN